MRRKYIISVSGKRHEWCFTVEGDDASVQDWRDDGLEVFELVNSVPSWVVEIGMTRVWCFFQDLWNLRFRR